MLQTGTIQSATLELLIRLQKTDLLAGTRLVGGTALALQLGHRLSIDLDFFGDVEGDTETIAGRLRDDGFDVKFGSNSKNIHVFQIDGIKSDIVNYRYSWIDHMIEEDGVRMAGMKDIAAMKIAAVTNRGSRKDFVDLYFLLRHFSMNDIMRFYLEKYPDGSEFLAYKSLLYFEDADAQVMPKMIIPLTWEQAKEKIVAEVRQL
jgi:predicted nucleotidyltransferase component of viral defense system